MPETSTASAPVALAGHTQHLLEFPRLREIVSSFCATAPGKDRVLALSPDRPLGDATRDLAALAHLENAVRINGLPPCGGLPDIRSQTTAAAVVDATLEAPQLLEIRRFLDIAADVRGYLDRLKFLGEQFPEDGATALPPPLDQILAEPELQSHSDWPACIRVLAPVAAAVVLQPGLRNALHRTFDEAGEINDNASPRLATIRAALRQTIAGLRHELSTLASSSTYANALTDSVVTMRNGRYCLAARSNYSGTFQGIVHARSATGGTFFVEPLQTTAAQNKVAELTADEQEEIQRILQELTALVGSCSEPLLATFTAIVTLDALAARHLFAARVGAHVPELTLSPAEWSLVGARHPLLAYYRAADAAAGPGAAPAPAVVPISVTLPQGTQGLVVTGPNTGGKTVALKTIGLISMMLRAGFPAPVSPRSRVCLFAQIFADIGDEQAIQDNLSTFSAHLRNLVDILAAATPESLVLLDELGTGTDPAQGSALALSILDSYLGTGATIVATTHQQQVKLYAVNHVALQVAAVGFDPATLRPTYELRLGHIAGASAFSIATTLGVPPAIVERARAYHEQSGPDIDALLEDLERQRQRLAEREAELQGREAAVAREGERLERDRRSALGRMAIKERRATTRAEAILADASRRAEEALRVARTVERDAQRLLDDAAKKDAARPALRKAAEAQHQQRIAARAAVTALDEARGAARHRQEQLERIAEQLEEPTPNHRAPVGVAPPAWTLAPGATACVRGLGKAPGLLATVLALTPDGQALVRAGAIQMRVAQDALAPPLRAAASRDQNPPPRHPTAPATDHLDWDRHADTNLPTQLDVRGMTADDALAEVDRFIHSAYLANYPFVRILHGKGTGALRKAIHEYLGTLKLHSGFAAAPQANGGAGVTEVFFIERPGAPTPKS
ncbi:MAG: Smr/MutS family protein [Candidatus Schekmanbacteria bacterium]|nr:Smr/MutS family protein [Candidatus Schekmanbacteria bacterium]